MSLLYLGVHSLVHCGMLEQLADAIHCHSVRIVFLQYEGVGLLVLCPSHVKTLPEALQHFS